MKRKQTRVLMPLCVTIFAILAGSVEAQQLQTSSTQQAKFFGRWDPPQQEAPVPTVDSTRERFGQLFPPNLAKRSTFQLTDQQPTASRFAPLQPVAAGSASRPAPTTVAQQPAPLLSQPPARALKPSGGGGFLQGTFLQPAGARENVARANHFEPSQNRETLPLPNPNRLVSWPSEAPKLDRATLNDSGPSLAGVVDSMQTTGKDLLGKFQGDGNWGQRIAAFVGVDENGRFKKVFGSLAVVVGGYLGLVALMRKFNFTGSRKIPAEVIEVIGSAPFGPRKDLQLVRLGSKLLLLMNSPEGTHPVGEITDPEEVDYLISLCGGRASKASPAVRSAASKFGQRRNAPTQNPRSVVQATHGKDTTFSTSQLVQALETIRGNHHSTAIFEA